MADAVLDAGGSQYCVLMTWSSIRLSGLVNAFAADLMSIKATVAQPDCCGVTLCTGPYLCVSMCGDGNGCTE